jgi:hypothetical protein
MAVLVVDDLAARLGLGWAFPVLVMTVEPVSNQAPVLVAAVAVVPIALVVLELLVLVVLVGQAFLVT